jgi:hypothetical protein
MTYPVLNGNVPKIFKKRYGFFHQKYYSAIFNDREVTIDDLSGTIKICVSTPPEGKDPGEVVMSWDFDDEGSAIDFLNKQNLLV